MLVVLGNKNNTVCVKIFEKFRFDGKMIKKILKIAIPSGIESALFQLGKLMTSTFVNVGCYITDTGAVDAAGNAITVNEQALGNAIANHVNNFASVVGGGVGTSCLTVIGQSVGAGDLGQCKYYMKKMFILSYIANSICVGLFMALTIPNVWSNFWGYGEEAAGIAQKCLFFCLSFQFVTYPLSFTTPAILKASPVQPDLVFDRLADMIPYV